MHPILLRLIHGFIILFLAAQILTQAFLILIDHSVLFPKWRATAGLLFFFAVSAVVLIPSSNTTKAQRLEVLSAAGLVSLFLMLLGAVLSPWLNGPHPMRQYAVVRHVNPDGFIESDEVYLRSASVVGMLESVGGYRKSESGGKFGIERYLYSPRIGYMFGKSLGDGGEGFPSIALQDSGISAWLLGIRVSCEFFVLWTIHFAPLLVAYAVYCEWKKKPLELSLTIAPVRGLFLVGALVLGLAPLIGT